MTRNTERRVEVTCPVMDTDVRRKIHQMLNACLADNVKGRILQSDGLYVPVPCGEDDKKTDCQQLLIHEAIKSADNADINYISENPVILFFNRLFKFSAS